eukprot:2338057-Rhodomonas_salina.1
MSITTEAPHVVMRVDELLDGNNNNISHMVTPGQSTLFVFLEGGWVQKTHSEREGEKEKRGEREREGGRGRGREKREREKRERLLDGNNNNIPHGHS